MTKNINARRMRQAIDNRQLHVLLSMIDSGIDLLTANPVMTDRRIDSALETIGRHRKAALAKLDPLDSYRAVKAKDDSFNRIKELIEEMFPDNEFGSEEWMHFWLAVHMLVCDALIMKVRPGNKASWRFMEMAMLKLIRVLAGNKVHELYETGPVGETEPLLGTSVGEALHSVVWSE
ncbi:hypothetical protein [Maridesulfovibrio sp. FT414]|uniref:hypothetical protein n=1 Tax=Maridesulfovibrio sp. FT414 TaxID=2979469 RepID=UPI003D803950